MEDYIHESVLRAQFQNDVAEEDQAFSVSLFLARGGNEVNTNQPN